MKKVLSAVLLICLFVSALAFSAAEEAQPAKEFRGILTSMKTSDGRRQSYLGPDRKYPGGGAYKPSKVTSVTVLFREGEYVYVDMTYSTVTRRCVYFTIYDLTIDDVEEIDYGTGSPATLSEEYQPVMGPGPDYAPLVQTTETVQIPVKLSAGSQIRALFRSDGWVFAEFDCSLGTARSWFPETVVRCESELKEITIVVPIPRFYNIARTYELSDFIKNEPALDVSTGYCQSCGGIMDMDSPRESYHFELYDEAYHKVTYDVYTKCRSCQNETHYTTYKLSPHDYQDGEDTCVWCYYYKGGQTRCEKCGGKLIPRDGAYYYPFDEESHVTQLYQYNECPYCGYCSTGAIYQEWHETHTFFEDGGDQCSRCGYIRTDN